MMEEDAGEEVDKIELSEISPVQWPRGERSMSLKTVTASKTFYVLTKKKPKNIRRTQKSKEDSIIAQKITEKLRRTQSPEKPNRAQQSLTESQQATIELKKRPQKKR